MGLLQGFFFHILGVIFFKPLYPENQYMKSYFLDVDLAFKIPIGLLGFAIMFVFAYIWHVDRKVAIEKAKKAKRQK